MKRILLQLDTDFHPSSFDTIVAYDGGAEVVLNYGQVNTGNVRPLVEGAIFTRPPSRKRLTAIFIGGRDVERGERLFMAVKRIFFGDFQVSVMFDPNGCNTTAAAAVVQILASIPDLRERTVVVLAGTGPVGQRVAALLAKLGARVAITSRFRDKAVRTAVRLRERFGVEVTPIEAKENEARAEAIREAEIVVATGKAGVQLLEERHWRDLPKLKLLLDANATPPYGIEGVEPGDRGGQREGKIVWGALGFGTLKLQIHKRCIAKLFEQNDLLLDLEEIFEVAREIAEGDRPSMRGGA